MAPPTIKQPEHRHQHRCRAQPSHLQTSCRWSDGTAGRVETRLDRGLAYKPRVMDVGVEVANLFRQRDRGRTITRARRLDCILHQRERVLAILDAIWRWRCGRGPGAPILLDALLPLSDHRRLGDWHGRTNSKTDQGCNQNGTPDQGCNQTVPPIRPTAPPAYTSFQS